MSDYLSLVGLELSALVALKVKGFEPWPGRPLAFKAAFYYPHQTPSPCDPPSYATDIDDAWELVEHMVAKTRYYELVYRPTGALANFVGDPKYNAYGTFDECKNDREVAQCIAICRASLKALEYLGIFA